MWTSSCDGRDGASSCTEAPPPEPHCSSSSHLPVPHSLPSGAHNGLCVLGVDLPTNPMVPRTKVACGVVGRQFVTPRLLCLSLLSAIEAQTTNNPDLLHVSRTDLRGNLWLRPSASASVISPLLRPAPFLSPPVSGGRYLRPPFPLRTGPTAFSRRRSDRLRRAVSGLRCPPPLRLWIGPGARCDRFLVRRTRRETHIPRPLHAVRRDEHVRPIQRVIWCQRSVRSRAALDTSTTALFVPSRGRTPAGELLRSRRFSIAPPVLACIVAAAQIPQLGTAQPPRQTLTAPVGVFCWVKLWHPRV
jgi:hypothetical protein